MKNKASFSPRSIQQAIVDHFEKVVLGAVVLVFLWILYGAWGREQLTWGPSDLSAAVSQAQDRVNRAQEIFPKEKMPQVKLYGRIAQGIRTPVDGKIYQPPGPMFGTDFPFSGTMSLRPTPELFPLRDLRVAAGCGAFAMGDFGEEGPGATVGGPAMAVAVSGSGAQLRGQRWAVVTGLIDFKKQRDAYDTAFQEATFRSPMDFPIYSYYYVERAEVDPQNPTAQLTWVPMKTRAAFSSALSWQGTSPEIVDPQFLPMVDSDGGVPLAFPLGPLQNRTWGAEVAHPPEIPVLELSTEGVGSPYGMTGGGYPAPGGGPYGVPPKRSAAKASEEAKDAAGQPSGKAQEEAKKKADAERRKRARAALQPDLPDAPLPGGGGPIEALTPGGGAGPSAMGTSPYGRSPYGASPYGASPYGASPYGMRPGMGPAGMSGAYAPGTSAEGEAIELPDVLLFRFFDFAVEPGKHYCYRVKLLLRNPNASVNPQFLESDDLGRRPHLETVMSDPSPVIAVPRDSQAVVVEAQPSATDPKAVLLLVHFNYDDGELANEKFQSLPRGQLLNFRGRPYTPAQAGAMGPYGAVLPDPQGEAPKVDYLTEALLLDVAGGAKLPPQKAALTECASVLLLDPDGKLVVREEIDDLAEVRQHDKRAGPGPTIGREAPPLYYGPYDQGPKKPKKKGKVQPGYPVSGSPSGYPTGGGGPPAGYPAGGPSAGYSGGGPPPGYPGSGGMPGAKGARQPPPDPYGRGGGGAKGRPRAGGPES